MPLFAGASPVAIAAVAAGVMLGKTETASQTASPLCARTPRFGASPSRMAALSTSGRIPSSTRSRADLGLLFSRVVNSCQFYRFAASSERTVTHQPAASGEGYWPAAAEALEGAACWRALGAALDGVSCPPAAGEADSCPPAAGDAEPPPGAGEAAGSGEADDAPPPGFPPNTGRPSPPNGLPFCRARSIRLGCLPVFIAPPEIEELAPVPP